MERPKAPATRPKGAGRRATSAIPAPVAAATSRSGAIGKSTGKSRTCIWDKYVGNCIDIQNMQETCGNLGCWFSAGDSTDKIWTNWQNGWSLGFLLLMRRIQHWDFTRSGWWLSPTPLKNDGVKVSWDDEQIPRYGKIKHVPNHQPVYDILQRHSQLLIFRLLKSFRMPFLANNFFMIYLWFEYDFHLWFFYGFKLWLWFFYGLDMFFYGFGYDFFMIFFMVFLVLRIWFSAKNSINFRFFYDFARVSFSPKPFQQKIWFWKQNRKNIVKKS